MFPFDDERLERYRVANQGRRPCFEMPIIDGKTITALDTQRVYDTLLADFERKQAPYRTRLYLTCPGYEELKFDTGEMMTMGELLAHFL